MKLTRLLVSSGATAIAVGVASPAFAGDIAGHVSDTTQTIALQAAQVRIVELDRVASTDRDGSYSFTGVPAGSYTLEVRYVGAQTVTQTVQVPESGSISVDIALGGNNEILVVGQAANQASALSRKRESDVVSDVLSRDAIGQFPDQNVAESLRRLPGVNILNDQGEGRFVSVRGLDPELNSTSLNGVRVMAPESDVRSVALDVISSDIIESIEVKKSLTPDMDGDTIGATIDIQTTSAFDRKKDLYSAKIEGSYNDFSGKVTPKGSFDFASRLGDNFGVSGGVSYYQRKFETDNVEADGWNEDDGLIFPEEVNYRDYNVERKRFSSNLNFDVKVGSTTSLYLRGLYSQFDDQEYRRETSFKLEDAGEISGSGDQVSFTDEDGEISVQRSIKDRFERQKIATAVFGGKTETDGWKAEYSASWTKSSERENGSVDPANFEQTFEDDGLGLTLDFADMHKPQYSVSGAVDDFYDPSRYELDDISLTALSDSQDEEYALKFDLGREFATGMGTFTVQGGFKGRWRDKSYNLNAEYWENDDLTLADVLGEQNYRIADISPVPSYGGAREAFFGNKGDYELNTVDSDFDSAVEDYSVSEDVMAGYLLGRFESSDLRVIGGLRYEHTANKLTGNDVLLVEEDGTLPGGDIADEDMVIVSPVEFKRSYEHWLPSLNIRWQPANDLYLRLAGYRSLVRPKLSALAPRFTIEQNDDDEREGEFGNPDLKPYEAWNFDASLEYYLSSNGALSAAVFYKDVKNFIVDVNIDDAGTYRGIAYDEATIPINGLGGKIYGIEIGYSQAFTMLPAPFDGLLMQANYTYTNAKGWIPEGDFSDTDSVDTYRQVYLPASSKNTFNLTLGYEKGPLSLRVAGTYRDGYLDEAGGEASEDRLVDNHFQIDLSAKYKVTKNVQLYYEWVNVNNAKYFAYNNVGDRRNLLQFEEYKWTMKFGAKVTF